MTTVLAYLYPQQLSKICLGSLSSHYNYKMFFRLKLFVVLICFHSFSSHPDDAVFEENNKDINDGKNSKVVKMMLIKHGI